VHGTCLRSVRTLQHPGRERVAMPYNVSRSPVRRCPTRRNVAYDPKHRPIEQVDSTGEGLADVTAAVADHAPSFGVPADGQSHDIANMADGASLLLQRADQHPTTAIAHGNRYHRTDTAHPPRTESWCGRVRRPPRRRRACSEPLAPRERPPEVMGASHRACSERPPAWFRYPRLQHIVERSPLTRARVAASVCKR
jgi:hypothetical protein